MIDEDQLLAQRWCDAKGTGWSVVRQLGRGGTAPVFEVQSPYGFRALKLYSRDFSEGKRGEIEQRRIAQQLALRGHTCPSLVQIYDGGIFEERLFLVMSRASGSELEKRLPDVPRGKIRHILDQVARAAIFLRDEHGMCHRDIKAANIFVSDDFSQATLLDISVIRGIHDPLGIGTDHEGQLPVVATARYSPPEYLFRLVEPGGELWNSLTIYQMGALLHDLIMREPLFALEYDKSKENRYRFAWIVATATPVVEAVDVDQDLIFLARRALDKDWRRRSTLAIEDFLADARVHQQHALEVLGMAGARVRSAATDSIAFRVSRLRQVADTLESSVLLTLRKLGVTATHNIVSGSNDYSKRLVFEWTPSKDPSSVGATQLELELSYSRSISGDMFGLGALMRTFFSGVERTASLKFPDTADDANVDAVLAGNVECAIPSLATDLTKATSIQ